MLYVGNINTNLVVHCKLIATHHVIIEWQFTRYRKVCRVVTASAGCIALFFSKAAVLYCHLSFPLHSFLHAFCVACATVVLNYQQLIAASQLHLVRSTNRISDERAPTPWL